MNVVSGTPRWAVWAAYTAVASVVPSALWRTAVGFGADLGTTQAWREAQEVPGAGTVYVVSLSVLSVGAAALTFGLVSRWGEVVPRWVPLLRGRSVPRSLAAGIALSGAAVVILICAMSVVGWADIVEYKGRPTDAGYALVTACYLPALAWGPAVVLATWAYWRRRG